MSEELRENIIEVYQNQAGRIHNQKEFVNLCQLYYSYRPDMSCGSCILKHVNKMYNDKIKSN